jgi:plastocyanin domain-containing protein
MRVILAALGAALFLAGGVSAKAEPEAHVVVLTLKDHRFTPSSVSVPAGQRIRIELINQDPALEEFDSEDLHVEKDVTPNGKVSFVVGPLKPGTYSFMGELHADTAAGELKAVESR